MRMALKRVVRDGTLDVDSVERALASVEPKPIPSFEDPAGGIPPPHRPHPAPADARSEAQGRAQSNPEPQEGLATEARIASTQPCAKRARRHTPPLDGAAELRGPESESQLELFDRRRR